MQRYLGSLFLVAVYGEALECTSWSSEPSWPTYHIINPVSRNADGVLSVQPLNDANAIYMYKGIYHAMCQEGGGNFTHAVSNDLVHWYHLKNALSPEPNTTWNYKGACDGTVSFPKGGPGEGPVVLFGADCAIPLEKGLGDAPRVGQARPADVTDPYMVEWVFGPRNASFEGFPCSFPGKVWRSEVGPYWNMVCALNGVTPWARYTSTDPDVAKYYIAHGQRGVIDAARAYSSDSIISPSRGGFEQHLPGGKRVGKWGKGFHVIRGAICLGAGASAPTVTIGLKGGIKSGIHCVEDSTIGPHCDLHTCCTRGVKVPIDRGSRGGTLEHHVVAEASVETPENSGWWWRWWSYTISINRSNYKSDSPITQG